MLACSSFTHVGENRGCLHLLKQYSGLEGRNQFVANKNLEIHSKAIKPGGVEDDQSVSNKESAASPVAEKAIHHSKQNSKQDAVTIDSCVSRWLGADLQMLADNFWYNLPAKFTKISIQDDELAICIQLPFRKPSSSPGEGDWLASQEDIERIRIGFVNFLREQPLCRRRLANFFYSEFHTFLKAHTKRFRFSDAIVASIERSGARRLGGRPKIPIPDRAKQAARTQVRAIFGLLPEIQGKIKSWMKKASSTSNDQILERLKDEFDRERYPWIRYVFQGVKTLPAKRAYVSYRTETPKAYRSARAGLGEPERWSAADVAAEWTQLWFYREYGERYDLREIKKLLRDTPRTNKS
jgi:hypothetical protein